MSETNSNPTPEARPGPSAPEKPTDPADPGEASQARWQLYPFSDELAFWYPFTLAVAAFSPSPLSHVCAGVSVGMGVRMMVGLASIREPIAAEDVATARFLTVSVAVLGLAVAVWRAAPVSIAFMVAAMFLYNALHNVRTMVRLAQRRRNEGRNGAGGDATDRGDAKPGDVTEP